MTEILFFLFCYTLNNHNPNTIKCGFRLMIVDCQTANIFTNLNQNYRNCHMRESSTIWTVPSKCISCDMNSVLTSYTSFYFLQYKEHEMSTNVVKCPPLSPSVPHPLYINIYSNIYIYIYICMYIWFQNWWFLPPVSSLAWSGICVCWKMLFKRPARFCQLLGHVKC